ncbi:MAG: ABC transporter ATP-binding protein [Rhodanobacter sp.]|nr:MAG: ABC transporter ATP-binding protein [Rhodanobacter sp.]TAM41391.1 MAG: ABC transporter ATP-binding protein [Rhodanobacter sp.]
MKGLNIHVIEKRFDGVLVLTDIDVTITGGEFVAVVGPSGVGKTTLLNMVAGLDADYTGAIRYDGVPLAEPGQSPPGLGMVFQEPRLMPWLTVRDNVRLAEAERLARDCGYVSRADAMLEDVGLGASREVWPGQLSGGMQRRAALARAFVVEPWLLLMDEPFVSLDLPAANQLRELLRRLRARVRPLVLFVTHNVNEALVLADRILFLGDTPARVVLDYRVEQTGSHDLNSPEVAALSRRLLARHQGLLSEVAGVDVDEGRRGKEGL